MHDEERAASRAASALVAAEHDARKSRLWPRCLVTLPWPTAWPPKEGTHWIRFAFALGPLRTSIDDGVERDHALVSRAWGRVRHEGSLRAAPVFEPLTDGIVVEGDADVTPVLDTSASTPSVGSLLVRAATLTPSEERRLAGAYLANFDRIAFGLPSGVRATHGEFLAWLDRWRSEKPLWVSHDPSDLFADPVADRIAATEAREKKLHADINAELAALKSKL